MAGNNGNPNYGPRAREPRDPFGQQRIIQQVQAQVSFDANAFQDFIKSHGVQVIHYRAIVDPSGLLSREDNRAPASNRHSSDGWIYREAGRARILFTSNQTDENQSAEGMIASSSGLMTIPSNYEDRPDCPFLIMPQDRFYFQDIELRVAARQDVEASATGTDRLQFPATCVEFLIDANGVEYTEGQHFEITKDGNIKWISQVRPGYNPDVGRGVVYSIRYRYTPFFVCQHILHEIRVASITNPMTGERSVERMPYQISVARENVFHDTNRAPDVRPSDEPRLQAAPRSGGMLGPTG